MNEADAQKKDVSADLSRPNQDPQEPIIWRENLLSLSGIAVGMAVISLVSFRFQSFFLIPSLASSAIMLFMSYNNVFAQPRNVIGGHLMSVLAAIMVVQFFGPQWWSIALVVLMAALLMLVTNTIHPPGGGTAIAAYLGNYLPVQIFSTVILDCALIILAAVLINNLSPSRKYPLFWV